MNDEIEERVDLSETEEEDERVVLRIPDDDEPLERDNPEDEEPLLPDEVQNASLYVQIDEENWKAREESKLEQRRKDKRSKRILVIGGIIVGILILGVILFVAYKLSLPFDIRELPPELRPFMLSATDF